MGRIVSKRASVPDALFRLFGDAWETWEMEPVARKVSDAPPGSSRILAVPARQVIASPLWIDGVDPALVEEAAKLELEVRGLLPRGQGMAAVVLRQLPAESRTLVVAAVFPAILAEEIPTAGRFDASPFLVDLPPDSLAIWREGADLVATVKRGDQVVFWETNDRDADAAEIRSWLGMIVLRLRGEGLIEGPLKFACCVEGIPADRIAPTGCAICANALACEPSLAGAKFQWRPEAVILSEHQQARKAQARRIGMAVAAGYLAVAACLGLYFGFLKIRASMLEAEASRLEAGIEEFQPIADQWRGGIGRTMDTAAYPLEILSAAVAAMPPEGIRLTKFSIENTDVQIAGEADSILIANAYTNAVAENDTAVMWTKQMPQPRANNVTAFSIMGRIREP